MKQSVAIKLVEEILRGGQKLRSNMMESLGEDAEPVLVELCPKLFGKVNIVEVASRILDSVGRTGHLIPGDLFNLMVLLQLDPLLIGELSIVGVEIPEGGLEEWKEWFRGWGSEDD